MRWSARGSIFCAEHVQRRAVANNPNPYALQAQHDDPLQPPSALALAILRAEHTVGEFVSLRNEIVAGEALTALEIREAEKILASEASTEEKVNAIRGAHMALDMQARLKERQAKISASTDGLVLPDQVEAMMGDVVRVIEHHMAGDVSLHELMTAILRDIDSIPLPRRRTSVRLRIG